MLTALTFLSCLSVFFPLYVAIILFKKIHKAYYPFLCFIVLVSLSDLTFAYLDIFTLNHRLMVSVLNLNILGEIFILVWIYKSWNLFENAGVYKLFCFNFFAAWTLEFIYFRNGIHPNYYFGVFSDFIAAFLSVKMINKLVRASTYPVYANAKFVVCAGFVVYFLGNIIPCVFSLNFFQATHLFKLKIVEIADVSVTLMYFLFVYALLLMAREKHDSWTISKPENLCLEQHPVI